MPGESRELADFGKHLYQARVRRGLSQRVLSGLCGLPQPIISRFERGKSLPSLPQLLELGRVLEVSLQWFLSGSDYPGDEDVDLLLELFRLGVVDLALAGARVPGAFRPPEQVLALVVAGRRPDPRLVEAVPAVLAWNRLRGELLVAYARQYDPRALVRLAWLADVVLVLRRSRGFPGGCVDVRGLEALVDRVPRPDAEDDLGYPAEAGVRLPPVWKRWRVTYGADLDAFEQRARTLDELRGQRPLEWRPLEPR